MGAYNNKLIFITSCKVVTSLTFVFCLLLGLDLLLPTTHSTEKIVSLHPEIKSSGNRYSRKISYNHTMKVKTEHHVFPTHVNHLKNLKYGPQIELEHSPIFGLVNKAYIPSSKLIVNPIEDFRLYSWVTYVIAITSFVGLFFHKNTEQSINFGVVCFILMLIQFYLLRWI